MDCRFQDISTICNMALLRTLPEYKGTESTRVQRKCTICKKKTSYYCLKCYEKCFGTIVAICDHQKRTCYHSHQGKHEE